jgi:hypothetical protein
MRAVTSAMATPTRGGDEEADARDVRRGGNRRACELESGILEGIPKTTNELQGMSLCAPCKWNHAAMNRSASRIGTLTRTARQRAVSLRLGSRHLTRAADASRVLRGSRHFKFGLPKAPSGWVRETIQRTCGSSFLYGSRGLTSACILPITLRAPARPGAHEPIVNSSRAARHRNTRYVCM